MFSECNCNDDSSPADPAADDWLREDYSWKSRDMEALEQEPDEIFVAAEVGSDKSNNSSKERKSARPRRKQGTRPGGKTRADLDSSLVTLDLSQLSDENTEEEKEKGGGSWCWMFQIPCVQIVLTLMVFAAIFGIGLLVGTKIRASPKYSVDGVQSSGDNTTISSPKILVGAYYYPWHGSNFHRGGGYIRSQLEPPQMPALGEYDDSKSETIAQHLKWSRQANIGLWVTSWWGPNYIEDTNTREVIMEHEDLGDFKIALHYESQGRIRDDGDMSNVKSDFEYLCENYFDHPSYYHIDGRPVIVIYVTRALEYRGVLEEALLMMRSTANKCGRSIYLVGDHVFREAPQDQSQIYMPFLFFDAITNYDVYGSMGSPTYYAGADVVDAYYRDQYDWKSQALANGCNFIPAVSPGFNDRGIRLEKDHQPLSRRLTPDAEPGSLFSYALTKAKELVDPMVDNLLLVNSFNEWHEDSQIEPTVGETTTLPEALTGGVEYVGYGELYLDILRESTVQQETGQEQSRSNIFGKSGD